MAGNPVHVVEYIAAAPAVSHVALRSTCVLRRGARQGVLQCAVLLNCTLGTAAIQRDFPSSQSRCRWHGGVCGRWAGVQVIAACDPFASRRRVILRCLAQDEPTDRRQSGRDWTPDGTSYFLDGGGCRAKLPPSMRNGC